MNAKRSHEGLEMRLGRIDLQLQGQGEHIDLERIASIANGAEPTNEEALHLVGCDECTELLIEVGAGLEALSDEAPELSIMFSERPVFAPRKPVSVGLVIGGLCFAAGAMAAAGWAVQTLTRHDEPVRPPVERVIEKEAMPEEPVALTIEENMAISSVAAEVESAPEPVDDLNALETHAPAAQEPIKTQPLVDKPQPVKAQTNPKKTRRASTLPKLKEQILTGRSDRQLMDRLPVNGEARGFGQLRLNSKPAARIWIDGKERGWTPVIDLRLQAGPHDVRLVYESPLAEKSEERFRVLIQADQTWSAVRNNQRDAQLDRK